MKHLAILIPSLEPDERLLTLLQRLRQKESTPTTIIVVNDGSAKSFDHYFQPAKDTYGVHLLTHEMNLGKGAALKTAFTYILDHLPFIQGVITIDSDGQHRYEDMVKVGETFLNHPHSLVLGVRHFTNDVPFKSRFGNILTRRILHLLTGINLQDTQTGLRVIPRSMLKELLKTQGDRFEYELNMLLDAKKLGVSLIQVPIETIYHNDNEGTHFRVIHDSVAIYGVFIKYLSSAIGSFLIDILSFFLLMKFFKQDTTQNIMLATVLSRGISSFSNYCLNRYYVFQDTSQQSLLKYYSLVLVQLILSGGLVSLIHRYLPFNVTWVKVIVDSGLFLLSYQIQKHLIFQSKKED
ncbi:GtrA family protein [Dolosicoccus paucivorans]